MSVVRVYTFVLAVKIVRLQYIHGSERAVQTLRPRMIISVSRCSGGSHRNGRGLAASAFNVEAVREIYRLKAHSQQPPILQVHHLDHRAVVPIPEVLPQVVDGFWPGPLTIV